MRLTHFKQPPAILLTPCIVVAFVCMSAGITQNIPTAYIEPAGAIRASKLPGFSDSERWNKVREIMPIIFGKSKAEVKELLGVSTALIENRGDEESWSYQITKHSRNLKKDRGRCLLFVVSFRNDTAVRCTVEPLCYTSDTSSDLAINRQLLSNSQSP